MKAKKSTSLKNTLKGFWKGAVMRSIRRIIFIIIVVLIYMLFIGCDSRKNSNKTALAEDTTYVTLAETTTNLPIPTQLTVIPTQKELKLATEKTVAAFHTDWCFYGGRYWNGDGYFINGDSFEGDPRDNNLFPRFYGSEKMANANPYQIYFVDKVEVDLYGRYISENNYYCHSNVDYTTVVELHEGCNKITSEDTLQDIYITLKRAEEVPEKINLAFSLKKAELVEGKDNVIILAENDFAGHSETNYKDIEEITLFAYDTDVIEEMNFSTMKVKVFDELKKLTLKDHTGKTHVFRYRVEREIPKTPFSFRRV